jgi:hypothetical protein
MQGGQSCCCFHQVIAALPFSCSSVWPVPPPRRWGNSVLNFAFCPTRSALRSTTCPALGSWLVTLPLLSNFVPLLILLGARSFCERLAFHPVPSSQTLCFSQPLLGVSSASGSLALFCAHSQLLLRVKNWEFSSLPYPCSLGHVQHSTPTSALSVRLQFAVYVFQFC